MAPRNHSNAPRDDDLDERCRDIRDRILDSIDATLNELAEPEQRRTAITDAAWTQVAPLLCRQATCRRAKRCRRTPCALRSAALVAKVAVDVARDVW